MVLVLMPMSKAGPFTPSNWGRRSGSIRIRFPTTGDSPPSFSAPCAWWWTREYTPRDGAAIKSSNSCANPVPWTNPQFSPRRTAISRGPRDIAVRLGLNCGFVHGTGFAHEFDDLIAAPSLGVYSRVHHQAHGAEKLGGES